MTDSHAPHERSRPCHELESALGRSAFDKLQAHLLSCNVCTDRLEEVWQAYLEYGAEGFWDDVPADIATKEEFFKRWHWSVAHSREVNEFVGEQFVNALRQPEVYATLKRLKGREFRAIRMAASHAPTVVLAPIVQHFLDSYRTLYDQLGNAHFWHYLRGSPDDSLGPKHFEELMQWWEHSLLSGINPGDREGS